MAQMIPIELTQDMLDAGAEAFLRMVPNARELPPDSVTALIQRIWSACAVAHDRQGRMAAIQHALAAGRD